MLPEIHQASGTQEEGQNWPATEKADRTGGPPRTLNLGVCNIVEEEIGGSEAAGSGRQAGGEADRL